MKNVSTDSVRRVAFAGFLEALIFVRLSISQDNLQQYVDWNNKYGHLDYRNEQSKTNVGDMNNKISYFMLDEIQSATPT